MATVVINDMTYADVPGVDIPKSGGGMARFFDTSGADVSASDVLTGKTAFGQSGEVAGSMANNGSVSGSIGTKAGTVVVPAGYTTGGTIGLTNVSDLTSANVKSNITILGVTGSLSAPTISQDSTTKILSIS